MKFIHTADIHFDAPNQDPALASLQTLAETAEREQPDFVVIAGDLFNRGVPNTGAAGFPRLLQVIQRIMMVCPVAAVTGTLTHDLPGSYEVLTTIEGHGFALLQPGKAYALYGCGYVDEWGLKEEDYDQPRALILGCPEPGKEWFLAGANGIGKDEADQRIKEGMRKILLGLGAVRAEHPELPCVFIYHGAVAGATMQNGQVVEGGIAIGRDDLALVGADYYALGHIHLGQQIPGLPAYYPGSAYPVNWGEVDQKAFNLVEIGEACHDEESTGFQVTGLMHFYFPHPPRRKIEATWGDDFGEQLPIEGTQVWLSVRAPKEHCTAEDRAILEAKLAHWKPAPGSRVTLEPIPTETVRAAQITEQAALAQKVCIYAEASGEDLATFPTVRLQKADQLEREAAATGAAPEGLHIRIDGMFARGSIGIWKGQHVDEIELDLDRFDPGLVALIGPNGAGKSTLISLLIPYPEAPGREGPLQNYFRLRDSRWEVYFTDERTGIAYRTLVAIDGANATGSCEYHLFKLAGDDWHPMVNGRKDQYEQTIESLFGSRALFMRSAFVCQKATKNNPSLEEATKGEKKAIFRELAGLDYLQGYADSAKAKGNALEGEISAERAAVGVLEQQLEALPGLQADRDAKSAGLGQQREQLRGLELRGLSLKSDADALAAKLKDQEALEQRIASLEDQAAQKRQVITTAEELITGYTKAVEQAPLAQKVVTTWEQLKEREGKENERISGINKERARLSTEYGNAVKAHSTDVRGCEATRTRIRTEKARLEGDHRVFLSQAGTLQEELAKPLTEDCPTCHRKLQEEVLADLRNARAAKEKDLAEIQRKVHDLANQIMTKDFEVAAVKDPPVPTEPTLPPVDDQELKRIQGALAVLDVQAARASLTRAQEAATRTEEAQKQQKTAREELEALECDLAFELKPKLDPAVATAHQEAQGKLETARADYQKAAQAVAALEAEVRGLEKRIGELQAQEQHLAARREKIAAAQRDLEDWLYLERACGPDGIQALELDAMGPGIAEVANRLLSSAYGSRFSIEFRTTRMAGKGSKTKQVEDFSIWILDSEDGTEQELSTLSGGESVWIKRAIYDAFGIIRERSTGTKFLTVFADEADGALDPEAKAKYVQMLQQAHQESGRRHTLVITHSEACQEAIGQKIVMAALAKQEVAA